MDIPDEKIQKLREIYRKEYGVEISDEEAKVLGEYLVNLFRAVYNV
ncbi:MAG: hypothetical protein OQJ98_01490 [Candidatus Pacebacteria bacterium]|nr:hypothetical protein [Candidatus Paceibacterota bacterium]